MEYYKLDESPEREFLDLRDLGLEPVRLLARYRYSGAHEELPPHSHGDMMEICYLESGQQTYVVGEKSYHLFGGDVFVTLPHEQHGTGEYPESRGVLYWLLLGVPGPQETFLGLAPAAGQALLTSLLGLPHRCFRGPDSLRSTLHRIFDVCADTGNPLRAAELQNLLLRYLLDVATSGGRKTVAAYSEPIVRVMRYVDGHLADTISLADLAEQADLSLARFKSRFKQEVGLAPGDYVARQKMQQAARLLYETDRRVTDIAMDLGFTSSQYFATVFKRYTRHTPLEARRVRVFVA